MKSKVISNNSNPNKPKTANNGLFTQKQLSSIKDIINKYVVAEREEGLVDAYDSFSRNMMADYVYGLYHPDIVFNENLDIKSPSYLPIPTTNFRFKETVSFSPNLNGNFCLYWQPNFLGSQDKLLELYTRVDDQFDRNFSSLYYNNDGQLYGNTSLSNGWRAFPFRNVKQTFSKYRLTSACLKIRYTGKVINQSGMIAASATYKDTYRTVQFLPQGYDAPFYEIPNDVKDKLASFCDFDNIRQGQWAKTISVVDEPSGLTCIYVPTDPLNQVFVENATTIDYHAQSTQLVDNDYYVHSWLTKNANISYAICGYGLPADENCITVETYYNFEIIVNQEQMPYFNPKVPERSLIRYKEVIQGISGLVSTSGLVTKTKDHDKSNILANLKVAFKKAKNLYTEYYPLIYPLVKTLI
jgi:hypothetical protein